MSITFHGNKTSRKVKCLIDSGSQRSYLNEEIVRELRGDDGMVSVLYELTTFLGSSERELKETTLTVGVPGGRNMPLPVLARADCNLRFRVSQLDVAWSNLLSSGYKLAEPDLVNEGDQLEIQGLIGIDIIQFFSEFEKVPCMLGAAYKVPSGLVPFGNVMHFLHGNQIISQGPVQPKSTEVSFSQAITRYDNDIPTTVVNFVLQPRKSYFSPLETLFPESAVEQGLENMFNLDYVGCGDSREQYSQTDVMLVKEFEKGIEFLLRIL